MDAKNEVNGKIFVRLMSTLHQSTKNIFAAFQEKSNDDYESDELFFYLEFLAAYH